MILLPRLNWFARGNNMGGKHIAGLLTIVSIGMVITTVRGNTPETLIYPTPTIFTGMCIDASRQVGMPFAVWPFGAEDPGCASVTLPVQGVPMPSAGILQNLHVTGGGFAGPGEGSTVTIYVNGSATPLTCTVDVSGKCADKTHRVSVSAADEVSATFVSATNQGTEMIMAFEKR